MGIRSLTCGEIADCFDLPLWAIPNDPAIQHWRDFIAGPTFIPLKLTATLLNCSVGCLERPLELPLVVDVASLALPVANRLLLGRRGAIGQNPPQRTFLAQIRQYLSHDWIPAGEVTPII